MLARPVTTRQRRRLLTIAQRLRAGVPTSTVLRVLDLFSSAKTPRTPDPTLASEARTKVYFQLAPEDARALEVRVSPELTAHDLAHLPRYHAAVCVCREGETGPAFTFQTQGLAEGSAERARAVREASSKRRVLKQSRWLLSGGFR